MNEFIKVQKGDETIEVHPDALANHLQLGWVVVEDEPVAAETPEPVKVERLEKKKVVSRT